MATRLHVGGDCRLKLRGGVEPPGASKRTYKIPDIAHVPPLDLICELLAAQRWISEADLHGLVELEKRSLVLRLKIVEVSRTNIPALRFDQAIPHESKRHAGKILLRLVIRNELREHL